MNMYIGNLAQTVTENDLKIAFEQYGEVASVKIVMDRFSGRSKGFGFIDMPNNSEADKAIKALNKTLFNGNDLKISQSVEPKKKPKRRPRY